MTLATTRDANTVSRPGPQHAAAVFAVISVGAQIAYPLVSESAKLQLSRITVICFALASFVHVANTYGLAVLVRFLTIALGVGLVAEVVGVNTGFPFGRYSYTGRLSPELAGAAVLVPFAWAMMAWPALLAGRRTPHPVLVGSALLVSWDLFLDPQMVRDGNWTWAPSRWPTIIGIPVSNYLGWTFTAAVMLSLLHRWIPAIAVPAPNPVAQGGLSVPFALLGWTWFSETLGHLVFFHRPAVAGIGGSVMGAVLVYVLWCSASDRDRDRGATC